MPLTPDRKPGVGDQEGIDFEVATTLAAAEGEVRYNSGRFSFYDSVGEYDPRAGGGLSEAQHAALRQLIHFLYDGPGAGFTSGAYKETTYTTVFPTLEVWYEDNTKAKKILQLAILYTGVVPTTETWTIYDTDGATPLVTLTDSITYSGVFEQTRTRTWV